LAFPQPTRLPSMQLTPSVALYILSLGYSATAVITTRQSGSCTYYCPIDISVLSSVSYDGDTLICEDMHGNVQNYNLTVCRPPSLHEMLCSDASSQDGALISGGGSATAPSVCAPASSVYDDCAYLCPSNSNFQAGYGGSHENVLICQIYLTQYDGSPSYCLYSNVVCPVTTQRKLLKFIYRAQDGSSIGPRSSCSSSAIVECAGLATGWSHAYECAVDSTSSRILFNSEYHKSTTNTPLSCTTLCGSRGYNTAAGSSPAPWSGLNTHAWCS
jgi:hypothetical protein